MQNEAQPARYRQRRWTPAKIGKSGSSARFSTARLSGNVGHKTMIPGMKIIDDILKGLPENARLRGQIEDLRTQMASLQRENEELKAKLQEYESKPEFGKEAVAILKLIRARHGELTEEAIAEVTGLEAREVRYHISKLEGGGLIYPPGESLRSPRGFGVTDGGIDYLKK